MHKNNLLISVIIPVYQAEKFLEKCLTSIISQTYKNLEIILIDDGSKDKSPAICDAYAQKDKRIKVIHQKNAGVSCARNAGLNAALGDYICFIDADDYIEPDMLEYLLNLCLKNKTQTAVCEYDGIKHHKMAKRPAVLSIEEYLSFPYFPSALNKCDSKLFSKKIINKQRFNKEISNGEDTLFNILVSLKAKKIAYSPEVKYHYQLNLQSATNSPFNSKKLSALKAFSLIKEALAKYSHKKAERNFKVFEVLIAAFLLAEIAKSKLKYKDEIKALLPIVRKNKTLFLFSKIRLKYKLFVIICYFNFPLAEKLYKIFNGIKISPKI